MQNKSFSYLATFAAPSVAVTRTENGGSVHTIVLRMGCTTRAVKLTTAVLPGAARLGA
jgi:hypothetical protein